jgi:uncharacterized protein YceK
MRMVLLILIVLTAAGCAGVSAPQVQPGTNPPEACVDRFSGSIARTCR